MTTLPGALLTCELKLRRIREILEAVDNRCMAADGPVSRTKDEITDAELCEIYKLAGGKPGG